MDIHLTFLSCQNFSRRLFIPFVCSECCISGNFAFFKFVETSINPTSYLYQEPKWCRTIGSERVYTDFLFKVDDACSKLMMLVDDACQAWLGVRMSIGRRHRHFGSSRSAYPMQAVQELTAYAKNHGLFRAASGCDVTCSLLSLMCGCCQHAGSAKSSSRFQFLRKVRVW